MVTKPGKNRDILTAECSDPDWRNVLPKSDPQQVNDIIVEIDSLLDLSEPERQQIIETCTRANMAIYRCHNKFADRSAILTFASRFGLTRIDHHLCANDDGVSELSVASEGARSAYVPYSNRSLSWHTDGYYNDRDRQINSVILHCARPASSGGENALLDPKIAYQYLYKQDPRFVTAFEHPQCMTIPANEDTGGAIRAAVSGAVFSYDRDGRLHMRYSARKKNIHWRADDVTRAARDCLTEFLADSNGPVLNYQLQAGEGLISNNVLHNRTAFHSDQEKPRLLYRARFFDHIATS